MGSFIDIIIIGGVIVLFIVRIMKFLRKLGARLSAQVEQPAITTQESNSDKKMYDNSNTTATPELTYELNIAQVNKSRKKAKPSTENESERFNQKATSNRRRNKEESDISNEGEEFDLRQAIIYSEIMKPKYSDEEI
ncbi:MAG: hypothetical protein IIV10_06200 [Alistipes sp.]|nr:hypothetical protein [Alistipes sp.]